MKIGAKIVADSVNPQGDRITSYILTYPRSIHAELMTHRMFSRNAASSRAIPLAKMWKSVEEDTFCPIAWQKEHSGMQGTEYFDERSTDSLQSLWKCYGQQAVDNAKELKARGVTKQIGNRLLEPFLWYTVLVTATEYDNWFDLRAPKYTFPDHGDFKSKEDWEMFNNAMANTSQGGIKSPTSDLDWIKQSESGAEIHIQALAEAMWDVKNASTPTELQPGQWHIPFGDRIDNDKVYEQLMAPYNFDYTQGRVDMYKVVIASARCARLSYMTFDGEIDYKKDNELYNMLLSSKHMSPFEHCARAMTEDEYGQYTITVPRKRENGEPYPFLVETHKGWCRNFKGFISHRSMID